MYHFLIAEDERIERMALEQLLRTKLGHECTVYSAENGRQAVELFRSHPIQIAILDIEMPVMSGTEAAQIIFEENPNCCIIFLTAFDRFDYAKKAFSVRAMDYLLKPYEEKELLAVVDEAIHKISQIHKETPETAEPPTADDDIRTDRTAVIAGLMEDYVRENYMQEISMQDAAHALNYSEPYFCKIFKQHFGQSFTSYLTEYRIRQAKKLLQTPTVNIKDVGASVGYPDPNYFAKVFRRITSMSPSEYQFSKPN